MRLLSTWMDFFTTGRIRADLGRGIVLDTKAIQDAAVTAAVSAASRGEAAVLGSADLNTITTQGDYVQTDTTKVTAANNYPPLLAASPDRGVLRVRSVSGSPANLIQTIETWTGDIWKRSLYNSTTWGAWLRFPADPMRGKSIGNVSLRTLVAPGFYYQATSSQITAANDWPQRFVDRVAASPASEGRASVRVQAVASTDAHLIQVVETWGGSIYKRKLFNNTAWGTWREFRPDVTVESVKAALSGEFAAKSDVLPLSQILFETDKRYAPIGSTSTVDMEQITAELDGRYASITGATGTFDETALTNRYDDRYVEQQTQAREAAVQAAVGWLNRTATNEAGETIPYALVRKVYITRPEGASYVDGLIDTNQDMNSTSSALALQALALYAKHFPHRAGDVLPLVERVASSLISLQHQDTNTARFGGIGLAPGYMAAGCLTAAQAGLGLLYAYEVWGNGNWLAAAKRCGVFMETLINPNPVYQRLYGHAVIQTDQAAGMWPIADQITAADSFRPTATGWNLTGVKFLQHLAEVTGESRWMSYVGRARDFMAPVLLDGYDYFHTKPDPAGVTAGRVLTNWTNQSSLDFQDNQWHRQGDAVSPPNGTVGTDQLEYALSALYETGYDLAALRTAYEKWVGLTAKPDGAFAAAYDGRICLTGYVRVDSVVYGGATHAFGSYYDAQGAGELLRWKQEQYPEHYALSLPIVQAVLNPLNGALLTEDFSTVWGAAVDGRQQATQGTIPIAMSAIGLLETMPVPDKELTR